jgi:WD40 repeat protein/class 3 adenylate cyclase
VDEKQNKDKKLDIADMEVSSEHLDRIETFRREHATEMLVMMFTDIVGSTRFKDEKGDLAYKKIEDQHKELLLQALKTIENAQIIHIEGDSYLFVFLKPADAVQFALLAQNLHRDARERGTSDLFEFRVGIHMGTVIVEDGLHGPRKKGGIGDIRGLQVDLTARIQSLAMGGQVLCSKVVFDDARQVLKGTQIPGLKPLVWNSHGMYLLEGFRDPMEICEVSEEGIEYEKPKGAKKAKPVEHGDNLPGWRPGVGSQMPGTNWIIEKCLGEGGFGEVWLVYDKSMESRKTVFKFCTRTSRVRTLKRELNVYNKLLDQEGKSPPGIVEVRGTNDTTPPYYIELEYVSGGDLGDWIERIGKTAPLRIKLDIAIQMARALSRVHDAAFVHRDIKPANYLIEPPGDEGRAPTVKLCDFGIGQHALDEILGRKDLEDQLVSGSAGFTLQSGTLLETAGTYFFIAPELIKTSSTPSPGRLAKRAGTSSDLYSLGVTLYQLFAGDIETIPGPGLSAIEDPIIREDLSACLSENPKERPTAAELTENLEKYEQRRGAMEHSERLARQKQNRRNYAIIAVISIALILSVIFGIQAFRSDKRAREIAIQAQKAEKLAKKLLVQSLVAQGSILCLSERYMEAEKLFNEAAAIYRETDSSGLPALLGLYYIYQNYQQPLMVYRCDGGELSCTDISPDGEKVALGGGSGTVTVWKLKTGELVRKWDLNEGKIFDIEFSDNSRELSVGNSAGRIVTLNVESGKEMRSFETDSLNKMSLSRMPEDDTYNLSKLKFSENADIILAGYTRKRESPRKYTSRVQSYQGKTGKKIQTHEVQNSHLLDFDISPDKKQILYCDFKTARLCPLHLNYCSKIHRVGGLRTCFEPSGKFWLLGQFRYGQVYLYDPTQERIIRKYEEHKERILNIRLSSMKDKFLTASKDRKIILWDLNNTKPLMVIPGHKGAVTDCAFTPDDRFAVSSSEDKTAKLWRLDNQRNKGFYDITVTQDGVYNSRVCRFSKDGRLFLSGDSQGNISIWDTSSGHLLKKEKIHRDAVTDARFSANCTKIYSASKDKTIKIWDVETGKTKKIIDAQDRFERRYAAWISPDNKKALMSGSGFTMLWNLTAGNIIAEFPCSISKVCFSNDSRKAFCSHYRSESRIIDLEKGTVTETAAEDSYLTCSKYCSKDNYILVSTSDKKIGIKSAKDGKFVRTFSSGNRIMDVLAFSCDEKFVFAGNRKNPEKKLELYDMESGKEVNWLSVPMEQLYSLELSPDGTKLIAGGSDKILIWDFSRSRKYKEFEELLNQGRLMLEKNPGDGNALEILGDWYAFRRIWEWAAEFYERAKENGKDISHLKLAECYREMGELDKARDEYEKALRKKEAPEYYLKLCLSSIAET